MTVEIEIRTDGEVLEKGQVVGRVAWAKPYVESDIAGEYARDRIGCYGCGEYQVEVEDLEWDKVQLEERIKGAYQRVRRPEG